MKAYLISSLGFIVVILLFSSWGIVEGNEIYPEKSFIDGKVVPEINCADCHSDLTQLSYKHEPATDACDNCHSANENKHPEGQGREFKLVDDMPALCYMCHEEPSKRIIHAPVEAGECAICHSPHSSDNRHLLMNKEISGLCYECHD
ncbi:MAG: cytochrome c3 family protein, partial [Bacteroidales bacterium]|nr:cytochrome c3 family protein [Bacteroidales bacterium]